MKNTNAEQVIHFDEKRIPPNMPRNGFYVPMVVAAYNKEKDEFTIAADARYLCDPDAGEGYNDTAFYDIDDFVIPAIAIYAITGNDTDFEEPADWVDHYFFMVSSPVNAE